MKDALCAICGTGEGRLEQYNYFLSEILPKAWQHMLNKPASNFAHANCVELIRVRLMYDVAEKY